MGRPKLSESEPKSNLNGLAQPPKKRGRPAKSTESAPVKKSKSKPKQINSQTTELSKPADQVQPVKRPKLLPKKPIEKPLFSAKALRANFNPLPTTILDYSSFDSLSTNWRCGNRLNLFTFEKHAWIRTGQDITRYALIFGAGDMGQMGQGPDKLDDIRKPVLHPLIEELKLKGQMSQPQHLAGGGMHTLLVDDDGQIWSWGINDNAALGRKTEGIEGVEQEELESRPMLVSALNPQSNPDSGSHPFKAARVSAGDSVSVAISDQGELVAWGSFRSNDGLLGFDGKVGTAIKQFVPTRVSNLADYPVSQVVCGYDHVLALTTDGHVYSWGNGQQQQLGRKIIERRKKNGLAPERLSLKRIVLIGSGGSHSFAVDENGTVYGWGLNTRGQLGVSSEEACWQDEIVSVPTPVQAMSPSKHDGARVVAIEGGDFHSLFLLSNGEVWGVGNYENGEIGLAKSRPEIIAVEQERVAGSEKKEKFIQEAMLKRRQAFEKDLAKFESKSQKIKEEESTEDQEFRPTWNESMQRCEAEQEAANQGFVPGKCLRAPARLDFLHPIIDISCGTRHNLAVDNEGNAYSWGLGQSNELGQGKDEDGDDIELLEEPRKLTSKALSTPIKILKCAAGGTHSLLIGMKLPKVETNGN